MYGSQVESVREGSGGHCQGCGPEHVRTLRALRGYYRRLGQELADERKRLGIGQFDQAEISRIERD